MTNETEGTEGRVEKNLVEMTIKQRGACNDYALKVLAGLNGANLHQPVTFGPSVIPRGGMYRKNGEVKYAEHQISNCKVIQGDKKLEPDYGPLKTDYVPGVSDVSVMSNSQKDIINSQQNDIADSLIASLQLRVNAISAHKAQEGLDPKTAALMAKMRDLALKSEIVANQFAQAQGFAGMNDPKLAFLDEDFEVHDRDSQRG